METLKAIAVRKSTRAFGPGQIKESELNEIIKAAKLAPTARGIFQDVHLTIVQSQAVLDKINGAAQAATANKGTTATYNATTLIIVSGKTQDGLEIANASCIIENMLLAAADLGLGSVYIWTALNVLKNNKEILSALSIPEGFAPVAGVAVGYPDKPIDAEREPYAMSVNIIK